MYIHNIIGFTTDSETLNTSLIIILVVSVTVLIAVLIGLLLIVLCVIKRKCVTKTISEKDQEPTYEEVDDTHHKGIQMKGNASYGHVIHASKNYHAEHLPLKELTSSGIN
jgi:hypothetical protein